MSFVRLVFAELVFDLHSARSVRDPTRGWWWKQERRNFGEFVSARIRPYTSQSNESELALPGPHLSFLPHADSLPLSRFRMLCTGPRGARSSWDHVC